MSRPRRTRNSRNVETSASLRRRRNDRLAQISSDEAASIGTQDYDDMFDDDQSDLDDFIDDATISEDENESIIILNTPEASSRGRRRRRTTSEDSISEIRRELHDLQDSTHSTEPRPRRRARLDDTGLPTVSVQNDSSVSNIHVPSRRIDSDVDEDTGPKPPKKKPEERSQNEAPIENDGDDGEDSCTICFEDFTTNGEHRLVSLKCGHFFGKSCIERWIRGEKVAQCPQCKTKAGLKDIRLHYGRTIKMADNSELELVKKARDDYKRLSESLEIDLARLQKAIKNLEEKMTQAKYPDLVVKSSQKGFFKIVPDGKREIPMEGCKGIDFDGTFIYVGMKRSSGLFEQYSITTLCSKLKQGSTVPLHSNKIRCICLCPTQTNLVLTVSEDSTAIIFDLASKRRSHTYKLGAAGWTGCWLSDTLIAVGLQNGRVFEFDLTKPSHQQPEDLTNGQGNVAILHLSKFEEPQLLLIASLRQVMIKHRGQLATILDYGIDNFRKLSCVASDPTSNSFVLTIPGEREKGHPTTHRLYKLTEEGALVKCVEVRRITSKSMDLPFILTSSLFNFAGSLISLTFEPDFNRLAVFDWSDKHKEVYMGMHGTGQITGLRAYPINEKETGVVILCETGVYTAKLKLLIL